MPVEFDWSHLEKLEAAVAWRREAENAALANVWHVETIAGLTRELRRRLEREETDERIIALLWSHVPGDTQTDVISALRAPGSRYGGDARLLEILDREP